MSAGPLEHAPAADRCALLLGTLLQYAKHPATPNSPRWVSIMVPDDFLREAEEAIGAVLANLPPVEPSSTAAPPAQPQEPTVADAEIKALYVERFGEHGWLGAPGSWFIEGVKAGRTAASPARAEQPLTEAQAIRLFHENHEVHRRLFCFEWFAAGIIAGERAHGITGETA